MPSPIGHALAGLTIHVATTRGRAERRDPGRAIVVASAAVAPDLDLLLRFVDGRNHHQQRSHSVGCALLAALAVALLARGLRYARPLALGLAAGAAWGSHVALDYLGVDTHPPIGIMALWPFSDGYWHCPWSLFLDIGRTLQWVTVRHDTVAVAREIAILLPLLLVSWRLSDRAKG